MKYIVREFYKGFRIEHRKFLAYIEGISVQEDREWYASLLLSRLMLVYFLQKKGFLDGDEDYLSNHLEKMRDQADDNNFFPFYQRLLLRLFYAGSDNSECSTESAKEFALIPYINGRLFEEHKLEHAYPDIRIANRAFVGIFQFFNAWCWDFDEREGQDDSRITPDILGYIFEKFTNQKETGAYYTKEDVTEYIAKNTIIPHIFNTIQKCYHELFGKNTALRELLQGNPNRYIYNSVRYNVEKALPERVVKELQSSSQHSLLNKVAPEEYALPGETWRNVIQRRRRYAELQHKLLDGKFISIDDFVTHNLDVYTFIQDVLEQSQDYELIRHFYITLSRLKILDPTCGAGAFLLVALNILKPLYNICLARMEEGVRQHRRTASSADEGLQLETIEYFQAVIDQAASQHNRDFFVNKLIITNNLYGVDIKQEVVEICKLRLFLKLVALVDDVKDLEPLAEIHFNVYAGNSLLGFATYNEAKEAALGGVQGKFDFSHTGDKPFHWFVTFREVMMQGGFDIIIGNPPYIEYSKIKKRYIVQSFGAGNCGNLYAAVVARSFALCREQGYVGLIVPLSICGGERFELLRKAVLDNSRALWLANFEIFPCRLFDQGFQRLSIMITRHTAETDVLLLDPHHTYVTNIQRWYTIERPHLMNLISYTAVQNTVKKSVFPKLAAPLQETILLKVVGKSRGNSIGSMLSAHKTDCFVYYQEATNYWMKATYHVPFYRKNGVITVPAHGRFLFFSDASIAQSIMAIMNSSLFYLWFATYSDGFHLAHALVKEFPLSEQLCHMPELLQLATRLDVEMKRNATKSTRNTRPQGDKAGGRIEIEEYRMGLSKPLLDQIDALLAEYYEFTEEEFDFIISYDIKYRMGKESGKIEG